MAAPTYGISDNLTGIGCTREAIAPLVECSFPLDATYGAGRLRTVTIIFTDYIIERLSSGMAIKMGLVMDL